ncbi:MAG TPA: DUF2939 domain-containing protein [Stenomitos sp.]
MGHQQRYLLMGGVIGAFVCGGGLYASPYIALYQMYQAVEHHDVAALSNHVNFPALRESLKVNLPTLVDQEVAQQSNPIVRVIGRLFTGVMLDSTIDKLVTPTGITALLQGQRLQLGMPGQAQFSDKATAVEVKPRYESFNRFTVAIQPKNKVHPPVELIMSRDFLSWKVSGVRFPRL